MAASMKMAVLWDAAQGSITEIYRRFRGRHDDGGSKHL
jgi:hypothetical protein